MTEHCPPNLPRWWLAVFACIPPLLTATGTAAEPSDRTNTGGALVGSRSATRSVSSLLVTDDDGLRAQGGASSAVDRSTATVAVLPFTNITNNAADGWIGAGIAETVIADLQRETSLTIVGHEFEAEVPGRTAAGERDAFDAAKALGVGRRLGAAWLVTGAYQRLGDQLRITARVVVVATGAVRQAIKIDGPVATLFTLQDEVAVAVARSLGVRPAAREASVTPTPAEASVAPMAAAAPVTPAVAESGGGTTSEPAPSATSPAAAALTGSSAVARNAEGRRTVRATRISQPIQIDGRLDDEVYRNVPPITGFVQQVPVEGAPVTERTEAWVLFDDSNIYITCGCFDEHPERIVASDMRRDSSTMSSGQDGFTVSFDAIRDERNGFMFTVTPSGAMRDGTQSQARANFNWNTVWNARSSRSDAGWFTEMAIPFKSLRYRPGRDQIWGIQLRRFFVAKNENAYLTPVSPAWSRQAIHRFTAHALLVGLEPPVTRNLEIKPYAMSTVTTDRLSRPQLRNDVDPTGGLDVKYGVTKSLTADLTYNTDFAQVEVDEAQVNLTRFSLVFPEKREFFLEGQDLFDFGSGGPGDVGGSDVPSIFYSRRIGLSGGNAVPVILGGRLTGKVGPWGVGALNIGTDDDAAAGVEQTNFTVVRLRRDILRRSSIGGLFTRRAVSTVATGANDVFGLDASFGFFQNVYVSGYVAKSRTEGLRGDDLSYRTQFNYRADRYGLALDRLVVEKQFNPEVGLLRRKNFRRNYGQGRFSPRTRNNRVVRQFTWQSAIDYTTDDGNHLESRELSGLFRTNFHNGDAVSVQYSQLYEFLPAPFEISEGVRIPEGGYSFDNVRASFTAGSQRRVSGMTAVEIGNFYSGEKKTATFRGRIAVATRLGIEPNISLNWVDLPQGRFTNTVAGTRAIFTMTPRMFVAALVQYSSSSESLSTNLRFRWEYVPGSDLFVVYTEGRSTVPWPQTELQNRGVIVKMNRLFRF